MTSLPDIADYGRNFAVMVRIQGPDPKGLKMRTHSLHVHNSGKTALSASGMLLPGFSDSSSSKDKKHNSVLVLTVASVIEPFLSPQDKEENTHKQGKPILVNGVEIDILVENKKETNSGGATCWLPAKLLKMIDISASSDALQSLVQECSGSLGHVWEIGWSFTSSDASGHQSNSDAPLRLQVEKSRILSVAILRVSCKNIMVKDHLPKLSALPQHSRKGSLLMAVGSPLGISSPTLFFNSISVGSLANSYPPYSSNRSLLTADIRSLPGMEGSPVFGEHMQLIGMLTRPLKQRIYGLDIQLVIPWEAIESSCSQLLQEENHLSCSNLNEAMMKSTDIFLPNISSNTFHDSIHCHSVIPSPIEKAIASICLIYTDDGGGGGSGGRFSSGIFLNKQGLILTNAHLLEPWRFSKATSSSSSSSDHGRHTNSNFNSIRENLSTKKIRVRLDYVEPWLWTDARVVYVSKGPLDVALLQLESVPDQLVPMNVEMACPSPGSKAYFIGHGLFGPHNTSLPSACLGVVSKTVYMKSNMHEKSGLHPNTQGPVLLETTAPPILEAVAAPLWIQMATWLPLSQADSATVNRLSAGRLSYLTSILGHRGTLIPHLNISIPCAAMEPIFKFSKDMKSMSILEELDKPNEHLAAIWAFMSSSTPKSHPSRFAKFMSSLPRKTKKLTSKLWK